MIIFAGFLIFLAVIALVSFIDFLFEQILKYLRNKDKKPRL